MGEAIDAVRGSSHWSSNKQRPPTGANGIGAADSGVAAIPPDAEAAAMRCPRPQQSLLQ
jgi:hypothetical protein